MSCAFPMLDIANADVQLYLGPLKTFVSSLISLSLIELMMTIVSAGFSVIIMDYEHPYLEEAYIVLNFGYSTFDLRLFRAHSNARRNGYESAYENNCANMRLSVKTMAWRVTPRPHTKVYFSLMYCSQTGFILWRYMTQGEVLEIPLYAIRASRLDSPPLMLDSSSHSEIVPLLLKVPNCGLLSVRDRKRSKRQRAWSNSRLGCS